MTQPTLRHRAPQNALGESARNADGSVAPLPRRRLQRDGEVTLGPDTNATSLRIGLCNEGKLSKAKMCGLMDWMRRAEMDILIISEGAWRWRSPPQEERYTLVCPVQQAWGGSGFLCKSELVEGRRFKMFSGDHAWSVTCFVISEDTAIVGAYITPTASQTPETMLEFLSCLTNTTRPFGQCFLGGDLNAASGTNGRRILNNWAEESGFTILNAGLLTHFTNERSIGTDLDLILGKGIQVMSIERECPRTGHARLITNLQIPSLRILPYEPRINWANLRTSETEFVESVSGMIEEGIEVETAITSAAKELLGYVKAGTRQHRIPRSARRQVRLERRKLRTLPRGSIEYNTSLDRINNIFKKWSYRAWRSKLNQLANTPLGGDGWKIVQRLSKPATAPHLGLADHELIGRFREIYSSNRINRPEWHTQQSPLETTFPLDTPFTEDEVRSAIRQLPNWKAPGPDGLPYEAYKACIASQNVIRALTGRYNRYLTEGYEHTELKAKIIPIPKAGGQDVRPICLLDSQRKILEKAIMNRLNCIDLGLHDSQSGFRPKMSSLRTLLTVQIAILEANHHKKFLAISSYDVYKAFDQVPKALLASKLENLLRPHCSRLGRLISCLIKTPIRTRIGSEILELTTGAPQGGILSPLSYITVEDVLCRALGDKLGKYADDNTTMCWSHAERQLAEETIRTHYAYWGGRLNENKTQVLLLNETPETQSISIKVLGAEIGSTGIQHRVSSAMFITAASWLSQLIAQGYGLTVPQTLTVARAKSWAPVAYALPLALPPLRLTSYAWFRLCRLILNTYPTANTLHIVQTMGVLNIPYWWGIKSVITFYANSLADPYIRRRLDTHRGAERCLQERIDEYLHSAGITWRDLKETSDVRGLLHRARIRYIAWITLEIQKEARRLGIEPQSHPRLSAAKYTTLRNGRYGFPFLQGHMGPPDRLPADCFFCGVPDQDTGRHLIYTCTGILQRPTVSDATWKLADSCEPQELAKVLKWMKSVWQERVKRWKAQGSPIQASRARLPKSTFLMSMNAPTARPRRQRRTTAEAQLGTPNEPARQRRRTTQDRTEESQPPPHRLQRGSSSLVITRTDPPDPPSNSASGMNAPTHPRARVRPRENDDDGPPRRRQRIAPPRQGEQEELAERDEQTTAPLRRGRWAPEEDVRLLEALVTTQDLYELARAVQTRDTRQISSRLATAEFRNKMSSAGTTRTATRTNRSVRWSEDDIVQLMTAINAVGNAYEFARIHERIPDRSIASITRKVNTLFACDKIGIRDGRYVLLP